MSRRRESCFPAPGKDWPGVGWFDLNWMILISNTAKTWFHNADDLHGWCHALAFLVFSAPKKVVSWRRESLLSGARKGQPGAGWLVCLVKNQFVIQVTFVLPAKKDA